MAFPGASEVDLILALQQGAITANDWSSFLARLADMTGARFATIVSRVPGLPDPVDVKAAMPSGQSMPIDKPALAFVLTERMRPERIYAAEELAELTDAHEGLSLDVALGRLGAVSVNAVRVAVPTVSIGLGIFGARRFDAADGAVLRRLFPYLLAAARTASRVWHERLGATMTADLARRNCLGWFLFDRVGAVLDSWIAVGGVAQGVRILPGVHGDRLALDDPATEAALIAILDGFGAGHERQARAIWVSHDPPLHIQIAPVPPQWTFDPRQPVALATLHGQTRPRADSAALLVDLFGLLPSEARLAVALAGGDRLSDAAEKLGLTIETARNYSKKIFAKTGQRSQADLVRLVLSNGLADLH